MKNIIKTDHAPAPIGPYNQAILAGDTLYVSGQIALDAQTNQLIEDRSIEAQTKKAMENLGAILSAADMDYAQVVKCTIFVRDMADFATVNQIYGQYFQKNAPARETVAVSGLPKDVSVEISCIAVK